jgi:hypothetical protein
VRLFQQIRLSPQGILGPLAFGDIVVGLQDPKRPLPLIPL